MCTGRFHIQRKIEIKKDDTGEACNRIKLLDFGVQSPTEKIVLSRHKNRWAANICVLKRMRLCRLEFQIRRRQNSNCRVLGCGAFCSD